MIKVNKKAEKRSRVENHLHHLHHLSKITPGGVASCWDFNALPRVLGFSSRDQPLINRRVVVRTTPPPREGRLVGGCSRPAPLGFAL